MPQLQTIHSAYLDTPGIYVADVTLLWEGGAEERVDYGVNATDPAPVNQAIWAAIQAGTVTITDPPPPPPPPVPQSVTNWQVRAVLMTLPGANPGPTLYDDINAALTAMGGAEYAAWEYANEFTRHGALLTQMAAQFGLTETQLDDLFIQAKALEA